MLVKSVKERMSEPGGEEEYGERGPITFSFLLALNFFRQSTVSCLCMQEATVDRC
jgi:hypothetical protein